MFTGIIEEVGSVTAIEVADGHAKLSIAASIVVADAAPGDSIAVDGCCLTVASITADGFVADLMAETLRVTALGHLEVGHGVHLERAMAADGRFGGHVVQGHVDGVGHVVDRVDDPGTTWVSVTAPPAVARYLVAKGSITMAGTSLTVVDVTDNDDASATFRVGLIPHTLDNTTFATMQVGAGVNLEADIVGKYVERLVSRHLAGIPVPEPGATSAESPHRPDAQTVRGTPVTGAHIPTSQVGRADPSARSDS